MRRRRDKVTSHFTFMTDPNESLRYSVDVVLIFEYPGLFGFGLSQGAAALVALDCFQLKYSGSWCGYLFIGSMSCVQSVQLLYAIEKS